MSKQLKPGYKQTEVGIIPEDWEVLQLGRLIVSVEYGSSAKSKAEGKTPVLRMGNLQNGKILWDDLVFTDNQSESRKYALQYNDVLFNRTNTIDLVGKTSIYQSNRPAIFAGYLIRITVNPSLLNPIYLNLILNTDTSRKYSRKVLSVAVGQANINAQKLKTYPIPLPPTIIEQDAIAEALRNADALIESLEQLIAKERNLKQAAMQQLLNGKARIGHIGKTRFKDTDVGKIPDEWDCVRIGSVAQLESGHTPSKRQPSYWGGPIPWVSLHDTDALDEREIFSTEQTVTEQGLSNSSARLLPQGTVVFSRTATIGKTTVLGQEMATSQDFANYICGPKLYNHFLVYLFRSMGRTWKNLMAGSTHNTIYMPTFKKLKIALPPLSEQTAIVEVLSDMDTKIAALEERLVKTRALRQGMMQELLTGRIRLL